MIVLDADLVFLGDRHMTVYVCSVPQPLGHIMDTLCEQLGTNTSVSKMKSL